MEPERWYTRIEVELTTGRALRFELTRAETEQLVGGVAGPKATDEPGLTQGAFSTLLARLEKHVGEIVLPDGDGRLWILPASSIVALAFEYRHEATGKPPIEIGFRHVDAPKYG